MAAFRTLDKPRSQTARQDRPPAPAASMTPLPSSTTHDRQAWNFAAIPGAVQPRLEIGPANDPLEREADAVAERVVRMDGGASPSMTLHQPPAVQRKCSACEEEEQKKVRRKVARKETGAGPSASHASSAVHQTLNQSGAALDPARRAYFEPRFGFDFSHVRVHTDSQAAASAQEINSLAYAAGHHIVFGSGQYRRDSAGDLLLAHELAHVVQQGSAAKQQGAGPQLQRKLKVQNPSDPIPDPTGKGLKQTKAVTIQNYLDNICSGGSVKVDNGSGDVQIAKDFCSPPSYPPGTMGPFPMTIKDSSTPAGCGCICDIVASANTWKIEVDDASWPHTVFDDDDKANGKKPGGSGGTVTAPSPNSPKLWGAGTVSGKETNIDPWLVLGHELCGHAWMGNNGTHGPDEALPRGEGGHQSTVARENLLRGEHGIEARGGFKDPNCGESFWRDAAKPAKVNWSSYWAKCKAWRDAYNKKNGTKYKMTDRIP